MLNFVRVTDPVVLLSSRTDPLITVYRIHKTTDGVVHASGQPYQLPGRSWLGSSPGVSRTGIAFLESAEVLDEDLPATEPSYGLFELSLTGSLHITPLRHTSPSLDSQQPARQIANDSQSSFSLAHYLEPSRTDLGPRADREVKREDVADVLSGMSYPLLALLVFSDLMNWRNLL